MNFRPEEYFRASIERVAQAEALFRSTTSYALSMYCSGLAAESLLRAFRWLDDQSFEGRHNLDDLLRASRLLARYEASQEGRVPRETIDRAVVDLRAAIDTVILVWHNNLRYASESRCLAHLRDIKQNRGISGDPLKKNARDLLEAATLVKDRGVIAWRSAKKSSRR